MIENYIAAFEELEQYSIQSSTDLNTAKSKAINIAKRVFGEDSSHEKQIKDIQYKVYLSPRKATSGRDFAETFTRHHQQRRTTSDNLDNCTKAFKDLMNAFIDELLRFGIPEKKILPNEKNSTIINVNQNQVIQLSIIFDLMKDKLTGEQYKEVTEILEGEDDASSKKDKLFNKLKSFGGDVAANILANLLAAGVI